MRGRMVAWFVVAAVLGSVSPFVGPASATVALPVWTTGDYWEYEGSITIGTGTAEVTMRMEVTGTEPVAIGAASHESYEVTVSMTVTSGSSSITTTMTQWSRTSDLAQVRMEADLFGTTTTTTYDPPIPLQWPLDGGKHWEGSSTQITQAVGGGPAETDLTYEYDVAALTSLTVPAGTFEVHLVTQTMTTEGISGDQTTTTQSYFGTVVGNYVRTVLPTGGGSSGNLDLKEYKFQRAPVSLGTILLVVIVLVVVLVAVALVAFLLMRKKRAGPAAVAPPAGMPGMPPAGPPAYPAQAPPPAQPPQAPPAQPPPPPSW